MQKHFYTGEKNHQIIISLLKAHNVRFVVASPGTANSVFIGSIQNDDFFKIYSAVDERSAAYIACGLALESGEPVVISCTGATAARNYMSGMTEAYYSKLPILILTSSQPSRNVGHLFAQVTDRTLPPKDVCRISLCLPTIHTPEEEWECEVVANKALLELFRDGGGPVHLNLITTYSYNCTTALTQKNLPNSRVINRYVYGNTLPKIEVAKVGIFVGSHKPFSKEQIEKIELFCESNNAVVFCDHTSNYNGKYKIQYALVINQASLNKNNTPAFTPDLLIHIGEISGEEGAMRMIRSKETWRVSDDGELRDTFKNMTAVFEMSEKYFFTQYLHCETNSTTYYYECLSLYDSFDKSIPDQMDKMGFSNAWIALNTAPMIPDNSTVVLSILNTLRTWNYAKFKQGVHVYSPVGGFGIDGATSMLLGASLYNSQKKYFGIVGDLAFFYDLNTLGNRHVNKNLRLLVINNGCGVEFKKSYAMAYRLLENDVDPFVAAAGHFGNQSAYLVKHFAEDLGFDYMSAVSKSDFLEKMKYFVSDNNCEKPMLFEVFVSAETDVVALDIIHNR